jgi:hypothetical protein
MPKRTAVDHRARVHRRKAKSAASVAESAHPPTWIKPQLTRPVDEAPAGSDWLHEIKYDGYRMHARIDGNKIQLLTRTGLDWSHRYKRTIEALHSLRVKSAYLAAELCALNADGLPVFSRLQETAVGLFDKHPRTFGLLLARPTCHRTKRRANRLQSPSRRNSRRCLPLASRRRDRRLQGDAGLTGAIWRIASRVVLLLRWNERGRVLMSDKPGAIALGDKHREPGWKRDRLAILYNRKLVKTGNHDSVVTQQDGAPFTDCVLVARPLHRSEIGSDCVGPFGHDGTQGSKQKRVRPVALH